MNSISIFQCIPAYKPLPVARLIRALGGDCKVLLDIEDSIQDVQSPELNPILKARARQDLSEIAHNMAGQKFSIRINAVRGAEFMHDITLLRELGDSIESIFIPKVESSNDIARLFEALGRECRLNLIVETQKGIQQIDEILSSPFKHKIDFVFFGNYDFHLDTNVFPITEQHDMAYWKMIEPLIAGIERKGIAYGNSPYANIADTDCLNFMVMQLSKLCKRNFALMSLHRSQTEHFRSAVAKLEISQMGSLEPRMTDFSLDTFIRNKQKGRSFAMENNRIITPQEYLLLLHRQHG